MPREGTLLLGRSQVSGLLGLKDCIAAVEKIFLWQGEGKLSPPGILGLRTPRGGLHVKAGVLPGAKSYVVAKLNTNFPGNRAEFDLPTIQGVIVLCDAENGRPLALLDSIEVTIRRTAAASAVAAKYLARKEASAATICGCGAQARAQLRAIHSVRPLEKIYAFDRDERAAETLARDLRNELPVEPVRDLPAALQKSDIGVTCTTAREFFVHREDVAPGTFIAAVGADDAHKQEIDPALMASAKVVADNLDQCCAIGDLHHAISSGRMGRADVYAELSEIVAGRKPGRTRDDEIIVFDSTGVALEDAVSAAAVYENACARGIGQHFDFAA